VRYLFETSDALGEEPRLEVEAFTAKASRNDYEVWNVFLVLFTF
jgi:hypothetical protein